jgi:DnaJ-class molecular chaperone
MASRSDLERCSIRIGISDATIVVFLAAESSQQERVPMTTCPRCNGTGLVPTASHTNMINSPCPIECGDCDGIGSIQTIFPLDVVCPKCHSCKNVKCTERGKGIIARVFTDTFHEERVVEAQKREGCAQKVEQ